MKKVFELKCRFCNNNMFYKRQESCNAIYYCKSDSCKLFGRNRYYTFLDYTKGIIVKEIILLSVSKDVNVLLKHKLTFAVLKNNNNCFVNNSYGNISYGGINLFKFNIDFDKFLKLKKYKDIESKINGCISIL